MPDLHKNFATSLVATAPTPASSGTTLVVTSGHGSRFPTVPFNAVVCPVDSAPTPLNAEVVRVTNRSTDTLTITRAQEGSSARTIVVGDQIYNAVTAKTLTDAETGFINVRGFGAVGDGTTNDTAAIQAAIDAGGPYSKILIPASDNHYKFSNLKVYANQQLCGEGMYSTGLNRITGSTGIAIQEKTAAEGNAGGASGTWIRDLFINGNGTAGDGIVIGYNVSGVQLNFGSGLENLLVLGFPSGYGMKIQQNAAKCSYLWSNSNAYGIRFQGGGGTYEGIWAEGNTTYNLWISGLSDSFYHLHMESIPNPSILIDGYNSRIFGVDFSLDGVKTNLIEITGPRTCIYGITVNDNGHAWTNTIADTGAGLATGAKVQVPFYLDSGGTPGYLADGGTSRLRQLTLLQAWQTPTLLNSWVAYSGSYNSPGYYLDNGRVYFRGTLKSGTNDLMFTLPAGYRPEANEVHSGQQGGDVAIPIVITPAGNVSAVPRNTTLTCIDGISFRQAN